MSDHAHAEARPGSPPRGTASASDALAWRAASWHAIVSLVLAVLAARLLPAAHAFPWLAVVALLALVGWMRREVDVAPATRVRLALAWGVAWATLGSLAAGHADAAAVVTALTPPLLLGTLLFWSRPRLLAVHLALIALPTTLWTAAHGDWRETLLLSAVAVLAGMGGAWMERLRSAGGTPRREGDAKAVAGPLGGNDAEPDDFAALLDSTDEAVLIVDAEGRITLLNRVARQITGATVGERFRDAVPLVDPETRGRVRDPVAECLRTGAVVQAADWLALVAGAMRECIVTLRASPLSGQRVLVSIRDDTELRTLERLQLLQAGRDAVTGLLNRRELERRYRRLQESGRRGEHALCVLELQQVGLVNEACGHAAGDALLRQTAMQLGNAARADDWVARLGGGHFALVLRGCDASTARAVAAKLLEAIESTRFPWRERRFVLRGRVGVATFRVDGTPLADVLSAASSACRVAAEAEGERIHVYRHGDAALQRHAALGEWMQRVQHAVEHGRFELLAHDIAPIGGGGDGHRRNAELLVRMRDDNDVLVAPGLFLGAAERLHLMPAIDRWVVREALTVMARADGPLEDYGFCAINLSGQSLSQPEMGTFIEDCLRELGVPPGRVCFEITETAVIADLPAARELMGRLRERGCLFALDDFGTGLSSYAYLKQLPADLLKIDGAFVRGMLADGTDRAVVESINQVAHLVGMRTIAEYVQNVATLAALEQIGVDYAQGSLFGEPRPIT